MKADAEELSHVSPRLFVEAFGSLLTFRINRGLSYMLQHMLKDEERVWHPRDIQRLVSHLSNVSSRLGDISAITYKIRGRLRIMEGWEKLVSDQVQMLDDFISIENHHDLRMNCFMPLIKSLLEKPEKLEHVVRRINAKHNISYMQRLFIAKNA